jgi:predicted nucleotide-binding protein
MAKFNPELLGKIVEKLGVGVKRVYAIVQKRSLDDHVDSHVASLLVAKDAGVNYNRYATAEDRAEMRGLSSSSPRLERYSSYVYKNDDVLARTHQPTEKLMKKTKATKDNSIFVVHGRDSKLTEDVYLFLRAIGLNPIEWNEAIKGARGGANPIVGDVINQAMKKAQGIMVLLSPDEDAKLKGKFAGQRDRKQNLHRMDSQPRPNVIFEAGLALGAHSDKTILVQVGDIRDISDIAGKHMVHLTDKPASRKALAMRLRTKLKFKVNTDGDQWLEVGKFSR